MIQRSSAILFLWSAALLAQTHTPVTIVSGRITGKDVGDVHAWLGIPYAAPPVAELRWRAPRPAPSWEGMRAMDHYGPACMQPKIGTAATQVSATGEDCLTLNVWAPKNAKNAAVMFWIHGGAFVEGSGSMAVYGGASLARQGVVVVTINYRLGDLGFFATPKLREEAGSEGAGNFALMDQIAALRWVKENITAFGGDPANVTIFGESAGGSSVNFLMVSPPARGLFAKAIAESGGGQSRALSLADLEKNSERKIQQWGATDLKSARAVPADKILGGMGQIRLASYAPVLDGKFVPESPGEAFAKGQQAPVPFLLGANSFEASLMTLFRMGSDSVLNMMAGRERIKQLYGDDPQKASQELFTDTVFLGPARRLAADMEKVEKPAYLYFFSYVIERRRAQAPGAAHGGEIPFVFDQFPSAMAALVTHDDRKMAETVSAYWVQFAKTGNPNRAGSPEWPAYVKSSDRLLELGAEIATREHFRAERLNLLDAVAGRGR